MFSLSLSTSIVATVAYSDIFSAPISLSELSSRLIGANATQLQCEKELKKLDSLVVKSLKEGSPSGRKNMVLMKTHLELLEIQVLRKKWSKEKWQEVEQLKSMISLIPTVSHVYITGALAMDNLRSEDDDIDVMVVCKPESLWLTRLQVVWKASLLGKYRTHSSSGENGWCFNLWVEESALTLPPKNRNIYTAYEVIQSRLILGEKDVLKNANQWVNEYINYPIKTVKDGVQKTRTSSESGSSSFLSLINRAAYFIQKMYMAPHKTVERVGYTYAFFHPRNTKGIIQRKWLNRLRQLGVKGRELKTLERMID